MTEKDYKPDLMCSYCKKEMISMSDIKLGHHLSCENPWEQREINMYWDICCQRNTNFPMIKTSFEEFSLLNQKLNVLRSDLINYRRTIRDKSNRYELLLDYVKSQENILKPSIHKMPWFIFNVDCKAFLDPFNIEKLCKLLDIDIVAEDIYGWEKLEKKELLGFSGDLSEYPLLTQQNILKYRIHYVCYETDGINAILISEQPIDHITATFLYTYYNHYLSMLEIGYENYYDRIFVRQYRQSINFFLENQDFVKNQRNLIKNSKV